MSATTIPAPTHIKLPADQVRLVSQALAYRFGAQVDTDRVVNRWLLDLLPRFTGPVAQRDGMYVPVLGDHARTIRRALSIYTAADGIPAGWRAAADALWITLTNAYRAAERDAAAG